MLFRSAQCTRVGHAVARSTVSSLLGVRSTLRSLAGQGPGAESSVAKLLGVRTYFIDHSGRPTIMLVSMPRRQNGHTTFSAADMVSAIIDEYRLGRSLGYVATDDVSNSADCAFLAAFTCHPAGNDRRLLIA